MLAYLIIGFTGGLLSGLLGVGGGVIFVPLLTYLTKIDFKTNTGISSLAVVFVATASSLTYIFNDFNKGFNLVFAILVIVTGGIIGGYLGSKLTPKINNKILIRIFSLLLIATAYRMIFSTSVNTLYENNIFLYFLVGFVSGIGSGLLGIGGGIIRIPMLILFGGFEQIIAQGISLITTVPTALTAAVTKIRKNKDSIKNGVYVGIFGVSGSILGGNFAFNIPENILNISFGVFLIFVSINMFFTSK